MQYILTETEYRELLAGKTAREAGAIDKLQEVCTLAAQHVPVLRPWDSDKTPRPWGCILAKPSPGYCDDCPVSKMCPHTPKRWSK